MSHTSFVKTCRMLAALFCLAGAALLGYSASLPRYTDEASYHRQAAKIIYESRSVFDELRLEMLTPKDALSDYGWSLVAAGIFALLLSCRKPGPLQTPKSPSAIIALAFVLPLLHGWSAMFALDQSLLRGEEIRWAGTQAIPLLGGVVYFVVMLLWHLPHLAFLSNGYQRSPVAGAWSLRANWWLLAVTAGAAAWALAEASRGHYWSAIPTFLSAYFTLCLAAWGRARALRKAALPQAR